jgi:endoglucanase
MLLRLRWVTLAAVVACCCSAGPAHADDAGFLHTSGRQIVDAAGSPVRLGGVNWAGMESPRHAPYGLDHRDYRSMLDQMAAEGFNSLRLPFGGDALAPGAQTSDIDYTIGANSELRGLSPLEVMDKIIVYAGSVGLRVILDQHGPASDSGLWYSPAYSEAQWIDDWKMLAARYANQPIVVGADLHNEPHDAATWGDGNPATDWRLAAERAGNAILGVNPNWLIMVEGVSRGAAGDYWWGGNLQAAGRFPVRLSVPGRLVYAPHDYANDVWNERWFADPAYPANLPALWDQNWGYLFRLRIAPVLVGEFGTRLDDGSDLQWLGSLTNYMGSTSASGADSISWAFWDWGPMATDTGGILNEDWTTTNQGKQALLAPVKSALFPATAAPPPPAQTAAAPAGGSPAAAPAATPPRATKRPPVRRATRLGISVARLGTRALRVTGTGPAAGTARITVTFTHGKGRSRRTVRRTVGARPRWAVTLRLGKRRAPARGTLKVTYPGDATQLPAAATRSVRRGRSAPSHR